MNDIKKEFTENQVQSSLFALQDPAYLAFHQKLIPTISPDRIIGVRTPALRKFAGDYAKTTQAAEFMQILPHTYYEENNLHAFLIERIKDYDTCIAELNRFLPYVDNWATCDMMRPKVLGSHLPGLLVQIRRWLDSGDTYTIRFGMETLMNYFLGEAFQPEYLELAAAVHSEEYYIQMMEAWFFATALTKQYEAALSYLENNRLDTAIHNRTIQKAVESLCITPEQKKYLKTLKRRESAS